MLISVVSDSPLSYQWQFDDQDLAGQTNSVLMLDSVTSAQMGQYRMVVSTVCNGATNLWYGPEATVSIIVPLSLALQTVVTSTNILEQFNISGTAGQQFVLQAIIMSEPRRAALRMSSGTKRTVSKSIRMMPSNAASMRAIG